MIAYNGSYPANKAIEKVRKKHTPAGMAFLTLTLILLFFASCKTCKCPAYSSNQFRSGNKADATTNQPDALPVSNWYELAEQKSGKTL